ncbi:MAG TPA: arsenite methyltransferase [Gemmatimonadales bacterium]|nr:arsenite methyltransferase [Gemmatimonadales bacterium]
MTDLQQEIQERYGQAALRVAAGTTSSGCCGAGDPCGTAGNPISRDLYNQTETEGLPPLALLASLGCGNPTALAELRPGDTVLDLGSGGGIDVLLSARRVGPSGKAYGLDMTDEMLELARRNLGESGLSNVEFLKGRIEDIPLPDASVDVIISNCVINLSGDKDRVFAEMFRVLKPGGRLAISDVVVRGPVPAEIRRSVELWIGCVAGALQEDEYLSKLRASGFEDPEIEATRIYKAEDATAFLEAGGLDPKEIAPQLEGRFMGGFVRATKPETSAVAGSTAAACCGAECCA